MNQIGQDLLYKLNLIAKGTENEIKMQLTATLISASLLGIKIL